MVTVESGAQRAKKVVSDSPGLQLKITTSTKFPWEVGVAVDKYKYKYEKKEGGRNKHCQKFWHAILSACNAVVMLKIEARPGCTRTKGCGSAKEMNKKKKNHF